MEKKDITIFWFRRDLRIQDNAGLYHALKSGNPVLSLFIFDKNILEDLENRKDARVSFIHQTILELKAELNTIGSDIIVEYGEPIDVWQSLLKTYKVKEVFANHDFEPYAIQRDTAIKDILIENDIVFKTYKDHVIFEKDEVLKADGKPYTVFTPYSRKWKAKLIERMTTDTEGKEVSYYLKSYPTKEYVNNLARRTTKLTYPTLSVMGFEQSKMRFPPKTVTRRIIRKYTEQRNFPAIAGTSRLGLHFRFGTISIREKARAAQGLNETYLNELIWRDFYAMVLAHFPHVVGNPFRAKYNAVQYRDSEADFEKWCKGKTGYPLVDAGMRELNMTGYMHNRVRMVVASFLTKHLLIDWRRGESYFAKKLLDFDLASNNGGWQWAAGCGTDAAPYFRIFNPESQQKKFDKEKEYIKTWVPEYGTDKYPKPMVEHKFARERCLAAYGVLKTLK